MLYETLNMYSSETSIVFEPLLPDNLPRQSLVIDRRTGFLSLQAPTPSAVESVLPIFGIFGIVSLHNLDLIITITSKKIVGDISGFDIHQMTGYQITHIQKTPKRSAFESAENGMFIRMIRDILDIESFYFSYSIDITTNQQNLKQNSNFIWENADSRFYFNRFLQTKLTNLSLQNPENKDVNA